MSCLLHEEGVVGREVAIKTCSSRLMLSDFIMQVTGSHGCIWFPSTASISTVCTLVQTTSSLDTHSSSCQAPCSFLSLHSPLPTAASVALQNHTTVLMKNLQKK